MWNISKKVFILNQKELVLIDYIMKKMNEARFIFRKKIESGDSEYF